MRKKNIYLFIFFLIFLTAGLSSCKQYTANLEEFLSYWSSEAAVVKVEIKTAHIADKDGYASVASDKDAEIILSVRNPKQYQFLLPAASERRSAFGFASGVRSVAGSGAPEPDKDYTVSQLDGSTLKLVYKKEFLQANEHGTYNLNPEIVLWSKEGRRFQESFTFNIRANTPPPALADAVVGQTVGTEPYYVLCIQLPQQAMEASFSAGGGGTLLHGDITALLINGRAYGVSVDGSGIKKPGEADFISRDQVAQLSVPGAEAIPGGKWVVFYKTDVPVADGAPVKNYKVQVADRMGLKSREYSASTKPNKAETEVILITKGTKISGNGSESDPFIIGSDSAGAELTVSSATPNTTVHCTVSEIGGSDPVRYDGNPVTVPLGLKGAGEKNYKLEYYTDGAGFAATPVKTVYYKVLEGHTVIFNANGGKYADGSTVYVRTVAHNTVVSAPDPLPQKEGYILGGWYKDQGCTSGQEWNFATAVTSNITLYAQWNAGGGTAYRVEYYQEKTDAPAGQYPASAHETDNLTGATGAVISVTPKNYPGFEFDRQEPSPATIAAGGNTVVKVYYKRKTVNLTFNLSGGNIGGNTANVTRTGRFGTSFTAPAPVKTGYTFSGWTPALPSPQVFPADNANYTAQWQANTYTVTFSVEGGQGGSLKGDYNGNNQTASGNTSKTLTVVHGGNVTFTAQPDTGYEVESWTGAAASPSNSTTASLNTVTEAKTVQVKFKRIEITITAGSNAWKALKDAVNAIPDGGTITISGEIKATGDSGNSGEIIIDKDLTIQGKTGAASDILDANESAFSATENKHRIFRVKGGATLTLKNLTLKNGYAGKSTVDYSGTTGGGIRLESGTVSLSGVTISDCKARTTPVLGGGGSWHGDGAGIYVVSGTIIMENTTLFENDASAYGGAVFLNGGTLAMKGSTVVTPSTISNANKTGKNDVHLKGEAKIIVDGVLTGTAPVARIKVAYNEYLPTRQVLDGTAVASNYTKFTVTDQDLGTDNGGVHVRKWKIKSDGYLQSEEVTLDGSETRAWQALKDAVRTASDGDVIAIHGTIKATNLGSGDYVDNGEIIIDKNLTIKGKTGSATDILDANKDNGGKPKHRIFKVEAGKTLTLENLTLKGGSAHGTGEAGWGGVIYTNGGSVTIKGCTLTENHADYHGGCVYAERGTVAITGSTFTGNNASHHGGAVYTAAGSASMTDCAFTANTVSSGGGGAVWIKSGSVSMAHSSFTGNKGSSVDDIGGAVRITGGTVEITVCTFTGNEAFSGGAIGVKGSLSSVTMESGILRKNTATSSGGAVYIAENASFTMNGGTIGGDTASSDGNTAGASGGGVYVDAQGTITITGGSIKLNETNVSGGGIYLKAGMAKAEMTGGSITHNKAKRRGGGVYIGGNNSADRSLFTLTNGTVSDNTVEMGGGGVYVFGGDFTMTGGVIERNNAMGTNGTNTGHGGGVSVVASTMNMKGGEIKNNTAKDGGGGVEVGLSGAHNSVLNMSGGTISGNTLTNPAGTGKGVEFFTESTTHSGTTYYTKMKMSGSAKVDVNNDVYVNDSRMITVDGVLTPAGGIAAVITPKTYVAGKQVLDGTAVGTEHRKFTVTPNGSEHWIVGNSGTLLNFDVISLDEIKALESSMSPALITNRANLVNKLLFYKTSDGNYGVMVVTAVDNTTPGSVTFNYKTFNSNGTIKKSDNNHQEAGTNVFDLDSLSSEITAGDFWLQNSTTQNFQPRNGAKFYVLP